MSRQTAAPYDRACTVEQVESTQPAPTGPGAPADQDSCSPFGEREVLRLLALSFLTVFATSIALTGTVVSYGEIAARTGFSQTWMGVCSLIVTSAASLGYALSGPATDRHLFRRQLTWAALAAAAGALCLTASWPAVVFVGFALLGLGAGTAGPVGFTAAALVRRRHNEGALVGFISAMDETGAMLGPLALAGLLAAVGATASYNVVAILLLCLAAVLFAATPTRAATHRQQQAPPRREVLNSSAFLRVFLLMVAVSIPFLSFRTLWDRYAADIGGGNWLVGLSYLLGGLCYAVLSPVGGALFARMRTTWIALPTAGVIGLYVCYGFVRTPAQMLTLDGIFSAATALLYPGLLLAGARAVPERLRGTGNGLLVGGATVCALPVGPLAGWLYETHEQTATFITLSAIAFVLALPALIAHRSSTDIDKPAS